VGDARRGIPAVERLLALPEFGAVLARAPRPRVVKLLREVQAEVRAALGAGGAPPDGIGGAAWYAARVAERLAAAEAPSLRRVINATGVVLHTNLGRAPLAPAAVAAAAGAAAGYVNLEYDVFEGRRGSRHDHAVAALRELTGAEAALVVNNNAGAVLLALAALAGGREAVVSRGELVEIGGSFRIPDVMARSGARMVEVGTTNRTHADDYEHAIGPETALLVKVHRSNFRVTGFTAEVGIGELAELGRRRGLPVLHDLGSGLLADAGIPALVEEPTATATLAAGAEVVTLSGDKLLGGPQAGIVLGSAAAVDRLRRHPLCRALRVDKLTLAALEATLALHLDPARARREVPVLRMLAATPPELARAARALGAALAARGVEWDAADDASAVGGGACPGVALPTTLVVPRTGLAAAELERRLRRGPTPVVGRIVDGRLALDPRTVQADEVEPLADAVAAAVAAEAAAGGAADPGVGA
jgi:L-seryl-tRNA(Ser) seleniumtransferase